MILERLSIFLAEYDYADKTKGRYYGEATFKGTLGRVQLNLAPGASDAILKICADQVLEAAQEVSDAMVMEASPGLALKPSPMIEEREGAA